MIVPSGRTTDVITRSFLVLVPLLLSSLSESTYWGAATAQHNQFSTIGQNDQVRIFRYQWVGETCPPLNRWAKPR
jgi:hypothetical protein